MTIFTPPATQSSSSDVSSVLPSSTTSGLTSASTLVSSGNREDGGGLSTASLIATLVGTIIGFFALMIAAYQCYRRDCHPFTLLWGRKGAPRTPGEAKTNAGGGDREPPRVSTVHVNPKPAQLNPKPAQLSAKPAQVVRQ